MYKGSHCLKKKENAYVVILETKFAYFVIFATKMRVCFDFHDNNCVFGISGSNSCICQVFSVHTCTIHWNLPTKTVNKDLFSFEKKNRVS